MNLSERREIGGVMLGLRWGAHRVCVQAMFLGDGKNRNEDVMVCFGKGPGLRGDTGVGCLPTMEEGQGSEWPGIVKC